MASEILRNKEKYIRVNQSLLGDAPVCMDELNTAVKIALKAMRDLDRLTEAMWKHAEDMTLLEEYRQIGPTPGQLRKIDELYLDKCREVNELRKQLEEVRRGNE